MDWVEKMRAGMKMMREVQVCSLPEWHGRLVDMRDIEQMKASALDKQDEYFVGWNDAIKICQTAPTIVPAERSET